MRESFSSGRPCGPADRNRSPDLAGETTRSLLDRAQTGDSRALDVILERYLPRLIRWATGRLPLAARRIIDTEDLVQDSLIKVIRTLGGIHDRNPGTFPAYLRRTVLNRLTDETRMAARRPGVARLLGTEIDPSPTPLEETIGRDVANRYEETLMHLNDRDRSMIFLKVEMGLSYPEMADALDMTSADAARKATNRAVIRLAMGMHDARSN